MAHLALTVLLLLITSTAFAQSPYVSASVGVDVSRFSGAQMNGRAMQPGGGEAIAGSLRAGTSLGERWGLELGYTRPSEVETENTFGFPMPLVQGPAIRFGGEVAASIPSGLAAQLIRIQPSVRSERRDSTLETVAWIRQPVGPVDVVYLGGLAFNRTVERVTTSFGRIAILPLPSSVRTTTYGVAPVVGIEGRIGMTEHLRLVAGTRLQTIGGNTGRSGWLVRPSAGLMWMF